jgi:hypothetical protein
MHIIYELFTSLFPTDATTGATTAAVANSAAAEDREGYGASLGGPKTS